MQRLVLFAVCWSVWFHAIADGNTPAPPRLAVISDAGTKDLASLLTAEVSSSEALTLIDRDSIAKIGDEAKVQQMAGADATALGKLLAADGLLFLEQRPDGMHVRLTAVNIGYALFDEPVPAGPDSRQEAKALAHLLEIDAPKLKLDATHGVPISVLNLRADFATAESLKLERDLTLLVEGQLAAVPEYVVLERRHAWDLGFERSLESKQAPLLEGAFVVDGTLSQSAPGEITVHLRIRPPHSEPLESVLKGTTTDQTGLAQNVVTAIKKATGSSSTAEWRPETEAHEYLLEGIWGWQHKVTNPALEALDAAELLGEKAPQLFAVRSEVLGAIASADLKIQNGRIILPDGPPALPSDQRTATIIRAIQDAARFTEIKNAPQPSPDPAVLAATQWIDPASTIIPLTSNILVLLDRDDPTQSSTVRTGLRDLTKFDPGHGTLGPFHANGYAGTRDLYLEEWPATLEEQLAAYRIVCANPNDWVPTVMMQDSAGFCSRFLKTADDQRKQFDAVVQSLQDLPSAQTRYLLIMSCSRDPAVADKAYQAYLGVLWTQRDAFVKTRSYVPDWACSRELPDQVKRRNAKAALPLLHYVLANRDRLDGYDIPLTLLWQPAGWSREDAASLWKEYQAYKARVAVDTLDAYFQIFERPFVQQFPDLAVAAPPPSPGSSTALVVTKFWYPWRYTSAPAGYYYGGIVAANGHYVWDNFQKQATKMLVRINLDDFSCSSFPDPTPEGSNAFSFCATPDALYAVGETKGHDGSGGPLAFEIARLDPTAGSWATQQLPDCSSAKVYGAGTSLYLFLTSRAAGNEDVIDRYDWDKNQVTLLASTRRQPAQNQFDNRTQLVYAQIYAGPEGKPCLTTMDGTYFVQETPGPWPEVFDSVRAAYSTPVDNATLVVGGAGEVVLLDPDAQAAVPLMAPAQPTFRKPPTPGNKPAKELPSWAAHAPWDAPTGVRFYYTNVAYHNDTLYIVQEPTVKGGDYTLFCFQKGKGRDARKISLRFQLDDKARADLAAKPDGAPALWAPSQIEHPDTNKYPGPGVHLFCTETGICLEPMDLGFWYLPYADIEAYLNSSAN
jgi:hypothetical protein